MRDGSLVKSYAMDGGVYEVSWSADSRRIAGCTSNFSVHVIDLRSM